MWIRLRVWFRLNILKKHLTYWHVEKWAKHFVRRGYEIAIFDNIGRLRYELVVWSNADARVVPFYYEDMTVDSFPPKVALALSRSGGLREWREMIIEESKNK